MKSSTNVEVQKIPNFLFVMSPNLNKEPNLHKKFKNAKINYMHFLKIDKGSNTKVQIFL
jgi:hypothetical protein